VLKPDFLPEDTVSIKQCQRTFTVAFQQWYANTVICVPSKLNEPENVMQLFELRLITFAFGIEGGFLSAGSRKGREVPACNCGNKRNRSKPPVTSSTDEVELSKAFLKGAPNLSVDPEGLPGSPKEGCKSYLNLQWDVGICD